MNAWSHSKSRNVTRVALLTDRLRHLIEQGVPEVEALEAILEDMPRSRLKVRLRRVLYRLRRGQSLSAALSGFPRHFPEGYVSMVEAGERMGDLPRALALASEFAKRRDVSRQRIFLGIFFPVFTTVFCFGVLRFLHVFVLPYLHEMTNGLWYSGGPPLAPPRMYGLFDMAMVVFACLIVTLLVLFAAIFYGPASKSIVLSRFCTLLQLVLRARLPLEECHRLARRVFSGRRFRGAVDRLFQKLYAGTSVAEAFGSTKYFCGELSWMITAGESRGDVPGALSAAASFHDLRADSKLSSLFNIAPPIITIAIAVPVGIVTASVVAFLRWYLDVELFAG